MTPTTPLGAPRSAATRILDSRTARALLLGVVGLVASSLMHAAGLPVRTLLPMHWVVLLGGLAFGWRAGVLLGVLGPAMTFLTSGLPDMARVAPMAVELMTYGLVAGLGYRSRTPRLWLAGALVAGRLAWTLLATLVHAAPGLDTAWTLASGLVAGLPMAALMWLAVPPVARRIATGGPR